MSEVNENIVVAVEINGEYVCIICLAEEDLSQYAGNNVLLDKDIKIFQCDRCRTLIYRDSYMQKFVQQTGIQAIYSVDLADMLKNVHGPEEMDEYMKNQTPFFRRQ